ncbi:MAG: cysteine--tRNA ligase [Deltaproteobacteria bacterium]|nr:cysteine--tRNA ligase [Deltaproteobacteria bacterium]
MAKEIPEIKVYNTLTRKKERLVTNVPGKLTMYSCGPTVYSFVHIGNLRASLVSDLFYRYFKKAGYDVIYVRNYTDVDDKIIETSKKENLSAADIAKKYLLEVEKDFALADMAEPTLKTTVTSHMPQIINMIQKILDNKHAYVTDEGEVFFSIESFPDYGKLSHKKTDELQVITRIEVNPKKKNPLDFTLWKPAKPGEPFWESPWCNGRPGWHIECSAMSTCHMGDQIDIHHGGEDLVFPHHENEIAQTEAATQKKPFVKYWLHNAFVNIYKEKMSKSIGNVLLARNILNQYGKEITRFMLLSVHYRAVLDFSDENLEHALSGLHRIYDAKAKAKELLDKKSIIPDLRAESLWGEFVSQSEKAKKEIGDHFANDFNVSGALARVFDLIREFNRVLSKSLMQATPASQLGAQALIAVLEDDLGSVLGFGGDEPSKIFKQLEQIKIAKTPNLARPTDAEIKLAIKARAQARLSKNFQEADRIRKDLEAKSIILKDSPKGTTWEYK